MDQLIEGVSLTPLKIIPTPKGAVLHMMRADSPLFSSFGELYFSEVMPGSVNAWKRHKIMVQNFAVPVGRVKFVLYDNREGSKSFGTIVSFELGRPDAYSLLTIPPLIWYGFACLSEGPGLISNCASTMHSPEESERIDAAAAGFIPYKW